MYKSAPELRSVQNLACSLQVRADPAVRSMRARQAVRDLAIPGQLNEVPAALGRGGAAYAADHLKVHEDVLGEGGFGIVFILQQRAEVAYEYTKATPIGCRTLFRLFFVFFNICN